jgi:hypothetical protein
VARQIWKTVLALLVYFIGRWAVAPGEHGAGQATNAASDIELDGEQQRRIEADEDEDEEKCRFCDMTRVIKRRPRVTHVHYGLNASGNQGVKDARIKCTLFFNSHPNHPPMAC